MTTVLSPETIVSGSPRTALEAYQDQRQEDIYALSAGLNLPPNEAVRDYGTPYHLIHTDYAGHWLGDDLIVPYTVLNLESWQENNRTHAINYDPATRIIPQDMIERLGSVADRLFGFAYYKERIHFRKEEQAASGTKLWLPPVTRIINSWNLSLKA